MDTEKILRELNEFKGTTKYFKSTFGKLNLTDGIQYLRDNLRCYWLIDIVESIYLTKKIDFSFIVWKIEVKDNKFKVTAWSDTPYKSDLLYEQKGNYTDFKLKDFEFYQIENVILLKSEY